jgi:hypothetical protein
MKSIFAVLILCVSAVSGLFFGKSGGPEWNSLRTTWGPNPFSSNYFAKQPLTVEEAKSAGFEQLPGDCNGKFLGQRFIQGKDYSLILIYDSKGAIAGVQMGIPISIATAYYNFTHQPMYNQDTILGTDVYILTAYFFDPKTICQSNGISNRPVGVTGTGLWLQNGTDPIQNSFLIPINQSDIVSTKWVQGQCFISMGLHYWYDNRLDLDCDFFFPVFLMYNKGELTGFGWATVGKYEFSKRTEYPPLSALGSFLKPVPTCFAQRFEEAGGFTTMHVYFNAAPWNLLC